MLVKPTVCNLKSPPTPRVGVLLTNLGTPEAATTTAIRRYLAEFLADRRVVDRPRWQWLPILHAFILRRRPAKLVPEYAAIWDHGAPLLTISQQQTDAVRQRLQQLHGGWFCVALGMRYGKPSISDGLQQLLKDGATRLLLLPLYPQYAAATTASAFDAIAAVFKRWRVIPAHRFIDGYCMDDRYIDALAASIGEFWRTHPMPERLLFSFHGLPKRHVNAGDPYEEQCHHTAQRLAIRLGLPPAQWEIAFQSRFGPEAWLQPYTDQTLRKWGTQGIRRVHLICPGFAADCLETLFENAIIHRDIFTHAGGHRLHYIPALNASPVHIELLVQLLLDNASGWL